VNLPLGQDPALLLKQEGVPMFSTDLSYRICGGHVVVVLRGELDLVDAAAVAAALTAVTRRAPAIIVDLSGLKFIDSNGVAALAHSRRQARQAGGDLLLAAPQQAVMRVLTITRLADAFSVYAGVEAAIVGAGRPLRVAVPTPRRPRKTRWPRVVTWPRAQALRNAAP
jgi:anti-sigma B factor antagonist